MEAQIFAEKCRKPQIYFSQKTAGDNKGGWKTQGRGKHTINTLPKNGFGPPPPMIRFPPRPRCSHNVIFFGEETGADQTNPTLRPPKVVSEGALYSMFAPSKSHDTFCPPRLLFPNPYKGMLSLPSAFPKLNRVRIKGSFGKRGLFQKNPCSREILENLEIVETFENPQTVEKRRTRPFSRDSREFRDFITISRSTPTPWSGPFRDHGLRPWSQPPSEHRKP